MAMRTAGLPVQAAAPDVALRAELHAPHVLEPHQRAVGLRAHHDVLELREAREASLRAHGEGVLLRARARVAAEPAGRVHGVLRLQRARDLVDGDVELRERVRVDPDADGVLRRSEDHDLADAGHARHRVVDVHVRVVREEQRVVRALRGVEGEDAERARDRLLDGHALVHHVLGQLGLRLRVPHVRQDLVHARIGRDVERDPQLGHVVAALVERVHVEHLVDAGHLLFDRRGDRLLERDRVGARIARGQEDLGRGDVRIQRDRQLHEGDDADDHHEDGDHHRDDRAVDEEPRHGASYLFSPVAAGAADAI